MKKFTSNCQAYYFLIFLIYKFFNLKAWRLFSDTEGCFPTRFCCQWLRIMELILPGFNFSLDVTQSNKTPVFKC